LRSVDPFLAADGGVADPFMVDVEDGQIFAFKEVS
jgi:hypothetical protein